MKIEEVVSCLRKIQRRYPGIDIYFEDKKPSGDKAFLEWQPDYIITLDLGDDFEIASVNIPVE